MNKILSLSTIVAIVAIVGTLLSCGPPQEADQGDSFFAPLPMIQRSAPPPPVTPPPLFAPSVNATIVTMVREQNERIRELMGQIAAITDRNDLVAAQLARADSVQRILGDGKTVPDSVLLGVLRDENSGLTGAVQMLQGAAEYHRQVTKELMAYRASDYVPEGGGTKPKTTYEQALQLVQKRAYAKAASAFQALLTYGVRKDLADDCYFWLGVSQFQLRNLSDAERAFSRVLEFRRSNTKEAAYLMLGQCYEQLGSPKLALATFEKGIKEFPHGSMRSVVERKIAQLN